MNMNHAMITAEDLEQTIVKSGLLCFGPFNTKIGRVLFKHKIKDAIEAKKKKFGFKNSSSKNDETNANLEFEIRRFPSEAEFSAQERDEFNPRWRSEVQEFSREYARMKESLKTEKSEVLDNLKLQSQVYRQEIQSLKRQIDALKQEKQTLSDELLPQVDLVKQRRR